MSSIVGAWARAQLTLMEDLHHDLGARDHGPARRPLARPARRPARRAAALARLLRALTGRGAAAAR
jgi:hypothetical protein